MKDIDIESIFERIRKSLSDFSPTSENIGSLSFSDNSLKFPVDRDKQLVPELVKYLLGDILKCKVYGPCKMVKWEVLFNYKDHLCSLALRKFGLRLYIAGHISNVGDLIIIENQIVDKLNRAITRIEKKLFSPFAEQQIKENNVTIPNKYNLLEGRVLFFQKKIEEKLKPKEILEDFDMSMISAMLYDAEESRKEALYYTLAMLDAYFSYLEHLFILLYPFSNNQSEEKNLVQFMSDDWGEKYKYLFDMNDITASRLFNSLKYIKENYTNYCSCGAFEQRGESLSFHLPGLGALPARLSNIKGTSHFSFFPVKEDDYKNISNVMNEFNIWLESEESEMKLPFLYIESGLDIPCDSKGFNEIKKHMSSEELLNELIEYHSHISDTHDRA